MATPATSRTAASNAYRVSVTGLVAALLCASAWVSIPVGTVPITLQVFIVLLAALLLPPAWAGSAVCVYLALGAIGVPVFSAGQGGFGVLAGPTGGYLAGFFIAAVLGSWLRVSLRRLRAPLPDALAAVAAIAVIYIVGTVRLAGVSGMSPSAAIAAGVLPFIGVDVAKAAGAVVVASAVRRARGETLSPEAGQAA